MYAKGVGRAPSPAPDPLVRLSRRWRTARFLVVPALVLTLHAATPADYRQKLGVYVWGKLAGGLPAAVTDVKRLGAAGCVRVAIGPSWDPSGKNGNFPLDVKIRRADYRALLA